MSMHILHIPTEEVLRRSDGERWCFRCRKRREFFYVQSNPIVTHPDDTATYYGPTFKIECSHCHTEDGDCFPGTWREWEGV